MNRLILIGNGFDLAHGMKTEYTDFILWYIINCFKNASSQKPYEDELVHLSLGNYVYTNKELKERSVEEYILEHYQNGTLSSIIELESDDALGMIFSIEHDYERSMAQRNAPFKFIVKSDFLGKLISECRIDRWVDIENLFYTMLKDTLKNGNENKEQEVRELNRSLAFIIEELKIYLLNLGQCRVNIDGYRKLIIGPTNPSETVLRLPFDSDYLKSTIPVNTLILNFNYTDTVEQYLKDSAQIRVNYIHGKLNKPDNPVIFGFGDELDTDYNKFELDRTKELLKFIKSFWYFKTSNYHDLLRFIQAEPFQVFILGHSCGLSDRTMLNMIFEHENCISIKIYYYRNPSTGNNNYTELTEEISRHFKDKRQMRLKIVPFD